MPYSGALSPETDHPGSPNGQAFRHDPAKNYGVFGQELRRSTDRQTGRQWLHSTCALLLLRAPARDLPKPVRQLRNRKEPALETPPRFRIGDRVRIARYFAGIPPGSMGTVVRTFTMSNYLDVRFDGFPEAQIVHIRDLELMPPEPAPPAL